jgi:phospho-N-acetylmuramoyl-pentapeptide-transferase
VIRKLTAYKIGQAVRDDGPQTHLVKAGTPTMGGALILVSIIVTTLLWADCPTAIVWVVLVSPLGFGAIGWVDDWRKVVEIATPKGLPSRWKYFWQSVIGLAVRRCCRAVAPACRRRPSSSCRSSSRSPTRWGRSAFIVITYFVIVGTSNAVNLTDGLDGLAIMPTVMVAARWDLRLRRRQRGVLQVPRIPFIPGAGELTVSARAMAGAGPRLPLVQRLSGGSVHGRCRRAGAGRRARHDRGHRAPGNRALHHGRRVRGRDAVGDAAGGLVQAHRQARIFRMAPLHHHYELKGWKENQVVVRFWIITMMLVLIGLSTLKLR